MPIHARIERADGADERGARAVHRPDRRRAVAPLPQDVGAAIAVDIKLSGLKGPTAPTKVVVVPSISQIAGVPSLPCHRMSERPSPLKSPVPLICQLGPGLNEPAIPTDTAVMPSISQIAAVPFVALPQNVRVAVAVEVAVRLDLANSPPD